MIHTKLAKKVLTKKEQKHLTEFGMNSMASLEKQIKWMKVANPKLPGSICWTCWGIGRKLGLTD